jgi:hypothetical protein
MMREISKSAKKAERSLPMGSDGEASKGRPRKYSKSGASDGQDCHTVNPVNPVDLLVNLSRISS